MWANLGDDRRAKCDIGDEVAVHDVHVQPVRAMTDGVGACLAQGAKVGAED